MKKLTLTSSILFFTSLTLAQTILEASLPPTPPGSENPERRWQHESQASVVQTTGNSKSESYSVKQTTTYRREATGLRIFASYLKAAGTDHDTNEKNETARFWDAGLRLDRSMTPRWDLFGGYKVESDIFAGYRQRHASDVGAKYFFVKEDNGNFFGEIGYRYTHENWVDNRRNYYDAGRLYFEGNRAINATNSLRLWAEYVPNFDDRDDYLINYEASIVSAINHNFALKVAYLSKTDNMPVAEAKKTDTMLTTALVAKF